MLRPRLAALALLSLTTAFGALESRWDTSEAGGARGGILEQEGTIIEECFAGDGP